MTPTANVNERLQFLRARLKKLETEEAEQAVELLEKTAKRLTEIGAEQWTQKRRALWETTFDDAIALANLIEEKTQGLPNEKREILLTRAANALDRLTPNMPTDDLNRSKTLRGTLTRLKGKTS